MIELLTSAPAGILRLPFWGLRAGAPADICLFDPDEAFTVDPERLHGKSKNTAFKGMRLHGKVKLTICRGKITFSGMDTHERGGG